MKNHVNLKINLYSCCLIWACLLGLSSCGIQKNILFQTPTSINPEAFNASVLKAEKNYVIQKGDYVETDRMAREIAWKTF